MNNHPQPRRATNVGSILLTPQENECLFGYLGRKCATLCSAVVQVYAADRTSCWVKRCCGVACLVKDNPQRSYFIRVFDIKEGKTMFEQEVYHNFSISSCRSYFISFTGDTCQIGLNFASEEEAKRFRAAINDLLNRRQRKTEKKGDPKNGMKSVCVCVCACAGPTLHIATVDIKNPEINSVRFHGHQQPPYHLNNILSHSGLNRKDRKTKGKKKKLTKADIGTPSNFQHIGHVGWDPDTGFDLNNLDPELKMLFDMCGISEAQLKDRETSKVIYDFIEKKGGVEAVKNELRRQGEYPVPPPPTAPPPPPSRGGGSTPTHSPTPPPSPASSSTPSCIFLTLFCHPTSPAPATSTSTTEPAVSSWRLRPSATTSSASPSRPPPPPAELDNNSPHSPSPGGKSALLEQIRGGAQLKKVEPIERAPATGVKRDALLDQIRQGIQLKTVPDHPESGPPAPGPTAGIVGALMEVMDQRREAIHSSDEDEDDDEDEDFDDDEEWED
uniref:WASP like actin nucleation promoting factor a n=1 Tax=Gasterosteus aculeatus aculeatus TaxID=481459 RepID=A0AAQ4Q060_GASAC